MPGLFMTSPKLVGLPYAQVADYPEDRPIAVDGNRGVYKGRRKVYLVVDSLVVDFYDWDIYGDQYRHVQRRAMSEWGTTWTI